MEAHESLRPREWLFSPQTVPSLWERGLGVCGRASLEPRRAGDAFPSKALAQRVL